MNIYHVIYTSSDDENVQVYVTATTQDNAVAAVQAADPAFQNIEGIREIGQGTVIQGS